MAQDKAKRAAGPPPEETHAAAMWGGRFKESVHPIAFLTTSSLAQDSRFLLEDLLCSIAHARMLGRQGIIDRGEADHIVQALDQMATEADEDRLELPEDAEDVHSAVEQLLVQRVGEIGYRLHTARSRNDQVAADFRLYTAQAVYRIFESLLALQDALVRVAERETDTVMPGYTHLQRAQPVLLAHHLLAYYEMFDRDTDRLDECMARVIVSPLGSGALAGVPYPVDRRFVAQQLGFPKITRNSIDAVSDRDYLLELLATLAIIGVHCSRLAEELVLWSTAEFGFVRLPDAWATGSSIMPQKKNPDIAELARGRTGRPVAAFVELATLLKGLPLAYNRDLQQDKGTLYAAEDAVMLTLVALAEMLPALEFDRERMRAAASGSFALATDYADYLARRGMPFRHAHELVGRMVRDCEARAVDLTDLSLAELQAYSPLFAEDAAGMTVERSIASRDVPGGTARRQVEAALRDARQTVRQRLRELQTGGEEVPATPKPRRKSKRR